jgi:hypothetical protein
MRDLGVTGLLQQQQQNTVQQMNGTRPASKKIHRYCMIQLAVWVSAACVTLKLLSTIYYAEKE